MACGAPGRRSPGRNRMSAQLLLLTPIDVSLEYGVAEGTVRRWLRDGVLPHHKPGGKAKSRILIARTDVEAFLAACRIEATAGPLAEKR